MKKIITIALLSFALFGCSRHYPRFVKNSCTGLYAIETGYGKPTSNFSDNGPWFRTGLGQEREGNIFLGIGFTGNYTAKWKEDTAIQSLIRISYTGFGTPHGERIYDTMPGSPLGNELTFTDEQSAKACWDRYAKKEAIRTKAAAVDLVNRKRISDSTRRQELSVFNCLHNYQ